MTFIIILEEFSRLSLTTYMLVQLQVGGSTCHLAFWSLQHKLGHLKFVSFLKSRGLACFVHTLN